MHHIERVSYGLITLVLIIIGLAVWTIFLPRTKTTQVFIANSAYTMTIVTNDTARDELLKKTQTLQGNQGLIMIYPHPELHSITPRILRQKTDIVWLNSEKEVLYRVIGLPPVELDKKFGPEVVSRYVLFLPAGVVTQQNTQLGSTIDFNLNGLW